ncbi:MAG: hypothetical protein RL013_1487 [Bacteroidota bacterium]|jgi:uncharacterized phage-associated protein
MGNNFRLNIEKTLHSVLFVLQRLGGRSDFHKVFKILYFADQKHLTTYGTPISGDIYVAMAHGPVPSKLYDIFKDTRESALADKTYKNYFDVINGHFISANMQPNLEVLSQSNLECLEEAITENQHLSFAELTEKSHREAWEAATYDEMSFIDIAREGGASAEMLKYIEINLENQVIFNTYAVVR